MPLIPIVKANPIIPRGLKCFHSNDLQDHPSNAGQNPEKGQKADEAHFGKDLEVLIVSLFDPGI